MTWLRDRIAWLFAPWRHLSDLQADIAAIAVALLEIPKKLRAMEDRMAAREDTAYENLYAAISTVKDGWASLVAERDAYKAAAEDADADKAAAVAAALEADSNVDAEKVEAATAALADLVPPAEEPPAEEPPAQPEA